MRDSVAQAKYDERLRRESNTAALQQWMKQVEKSNDEARSQFANQPSAEQKAAEEKLRAEASEFGAMEAEMKKEMGIEEE